MCDYSLHAVTSRPAVEGEELVSRRFIGGGIGLVSSYDLRAARPRGFWAAIKNWFNGQRASCSLPVVCIPPGAQLLLRDIPERVQRKYRVSEVEEVRFLEDIHEEPHLRDCIRFDNGRTLPLQRLKPGQRVDVLSLTGIPEYQREVMRILQPLYD